MGDHDALMLRWRSLRRRAADGCLVMLSLALWLGGTMLAALGCLPLLAMLLADGNPTGFFVHVQNLSVHYLGADAPARLRFLTHVMGLYFGLVALLLVARWPAYLRRLRADLRRGFTHG